MVRLAIVIPYFKIKHFEEALISIHNQTDKRFNLYIGDDNSHESPISLINKVFGNETRIKYKKFDNNLGSIALTRQWERCINLSDEEYIWLFSDDDLMPEDAVERIYKKIETLPQADLFRFNVQIINETKFTIFPVTQHPPHETSLSFLNRRLNGELISTACEYVFSRKIYLSHKGFVNFPLAWASDDATWLNYSEKKGIFLIPGDCISWRKSGLNISSNTNNYKAKAIASVAFINFIKVRYSIANELKLKWLIFQMNLLGNGRRMKVYFWSQIIITNALPINFIFRSYKKIATNLLS